MVVQRQQRISPAAMGAIARDELDNFVAAMTPGGIEAQEAAGQRAACSVQALPIQGTSKPEERERFEALGFVFGEPTDKNFVSVTFPAGWSLRPTDHSMWSELVDDAGRKVASMFYKAAFYDCHAFIRFGD